jgi:argininosuccinate lyase
MPKLWQKGYDLDRDMEVFTVGEDYLLDRELIAVDCLGSIAQAKGLARLGLLSDAEADKLRAELVRIMQAAERGEFTVNREDEDVHTAVENRLTEKLGDLGQRLHTGRSRNDQVIVDLRLYTKEQLLALTDELLGLGGTLAEFADRHRDVPMVGRTHMQKAMPSSVGLWAGAWLESFLDDLALVRSAYDLNDQSPLGSAASYGVPLALDRAYTAELLGFARVQNNVLYVNNSRGKMEAVALGALAQIAVDLSRLAQDLILFSLPEFGYFTIPEELCTGSSIMPQKRNPCGLELMRARAAEVIAGQMKTLEILRGLPSGYNRDLQETKEPLLRGLRTVRAAVRIADLTFDRLQVNEERLLAGFTPEVFATDRALELVSEGVPFREAYRRVAAEPESAGPRDPRESLKKRTHVGAAGNLGLEGDRARLAEVRKWAEEQRTRFAKAMKALAAD